MPLPKPGDQEDRADFMDRCMGDETMNSDFPDNSQRAAVCNQQWRDRNKAMLRSKAYSILEVKAVSETERVIEGIASTPKPDRVKDVVEPLGAKFALPMPLLWQHDAGQPVGNVEFAKPTKDGIPFKARIAKIDEPGELKNLVDKAWQAVKAKLVRGVSIGFKILDHEIMKSGGWRIKEWEWLELSLVTIPANAEATIQTIKSFDARSLAASGRKRSSSNPFPGASGQSINLKGTGIMQSLNERIAATSQDVSVLAERMNALMEKEDAEGGLEKTEQDEIAEIERDIKTANEKLRRLKSLEAASANAHPVDAEPTKASASRGREIVHVYPEPKIKEEPGIGMARWTIAMARCGNDRERAVKMVRNMYPNSPSIQIALKTDVPAAATTDPTWAGPLVTPTVLASEFVEWLRARTIVGRFGTGGIPALRRIPFNVKVPAQTIAGTGYWVGEGAAKPATSWGFTTVEHRWYKVANIAVMTEEIMRFSNPSIEVLVRDELANALQERMDTDFITPSVTVTPGVRPASITNGANTFASSAVTSSQIASDVAALMAYMTAANIDMNSLVFVMRQAQAISLALMKTTLGVFEFPTMSASGGTLFGVPVIVSNYVPSGVVVLLNANDVYLSDDGGVNVAMSNQASLEMETAPSMTANSGASPPTISAQSVVSMFQTNSVAIRAERFINWSRRRDAAVAYTTSTGWGNTTSSPDGGPL